MPDPASAATPESSVPSSSEDRDQTSSSSSSSPDLSAFSTAIANAFAAAVPSLVAAVTAAAPAAPQHGYTVPTFPAASVPAHLSPGTRSIYDIFPQVEAGIINSVIRHELKPADLWKLDPRLKDKAPRGHKFSMDDGRISVTEQTATVKDYPTFHSLSRPLTIYFQVLILAKPNIPMIAYHLLEYLQTLSGYATQFQWHAVMDYHHAFHMERRRDMVNDEYAGWSVPNGNLAAVHMWRFPLAVTPSASGLPGSGKRATSSSSDVCRMFNDGKCTSPCKHGRTHKCSKCGSTAHGAHACTSTTAASSA